jgi:hypothetical protein
LALPTTATAAVSPPSKPPRRCLTFDSSGLYWTSTGNGWFYKDCRLDDFLVAEKITRDNRRYTLVLKSVNARRNREEMPRHLFNWELSLKRKDEAVKENVSGSLDAWLYRPS